MGPCWGYAVGLAELPGQAPSPMGGGQRAPLCILCHLLQEGHGSRRGLTGPCVMTLLFSLSDTDQQQVG